jgi:GNAT superfamily N-acetyltransferase
MSAAWRIQTGIPADTPHVVALMEQYWTLEGIAGFESATLCQLLGDLLSQPHLGTVWIAREGSELVGYLIAVYVFSFEYQGLIAEIDELFVLPHARRHGLGTALLDIAEAALADAGCTFVQLQLGAANRTARTFYDRRGYTARAGYELLGKRLAAAGIPGAGRQGKIRNV